jgi:transcriptional regulator with XRE-family HTH domain
MIKKLCDHVKGARLRSALFNQEVTPDMGSARRQSPKLLAQKLLQIRQSLGGGLSQEEMVRRLGLADEIDRTYISRYETGALEPPLKVLLRYAELAGLHLEVLANDGLLMPDEIPCSPKSEGIRRASKRTKHGLTG